MNKVEWPLSVWTIVQPESGLVGFLVNVYGEVTVPAIFATLEEAEAAIGKRSGMVPKRMLLSLTAVSR